MFFHKFIFFVKFKTIYRTFNIINNIIYRIGGMKVGKGTFVPSIRVTWPHQVSIGSNCNLEQGIYFKYDGIWSRGPSIIIRDNVFIGAGCEFNCNYNITIGEYSNIASGCRFIDHDHGIKVGMRIGAQPSVKASITIGNDVWIGCNVVVLKGVYIGDGAVIGAGAVVTQSVPSNEIWAGVPAKKIGIRK